MKTLTGLNYTPLRYYPFGSAMPSRSNGSAAYRYAFNGKEKDKDGDGGSGQYDYGNRIYDPHLGRFKSVDRITKEYPELSPYQFASNTPIQAGDLDGLERLDMTNINAQKRSATITIVKNIEVIKNSLVSEVSALHSTTVEKLFSKGNTTTYVSTLPQNGQPINFITQQAYNSGTGYAIDVKYDVKLSYIQSAIQTHTGPEYSTVTMGASGQNFTSNMTFAHAGVASNTVEINPSFDAFSNNGGVAINENYEELISHEVGFHNMMGLLHTPNAQGNAIYPSTPTLESNVHNNIYPTLANTQALLQTNITTRQNLIQAPPADNTDMNYNPNSSDPDPVALWHE